MMMVSNNVTVDPVNYIKYHVRKHPVSQYPATLSLSNPHLVLTNLGGAITESLVDTAAGFNPSDSAGRGLLARGGSCIETFFSALADMGLRDHQTCTELFI